MRAKKEATLSSQLRPIHLNSQHLLLPNKGISIIDRVPPACALRVTELSLRKNNLSNLAGIQQFEHLRVLNLAHNEISDPRELDRLRALRHLEKVYLSGNPFASNNNCSLPETTRRLLATLQTDLLLLAALGDRGSANNHSNDSSSAFSDEQGQLKRRIGENQLLILMAQSIFRKLDLHTQLTNEYEVDDHSPKDYTFLLANAADILDVTEADVQQAYYEALAKADSPKLDRVLAAQEQDLQEWEALLLKKSQVLNDLRSVALGSSPKAQRYPPAPLPEPTRTLATDTTILSTLKIPQRGGVSRVFTVGSGSNSSDSPRNLVDTHSKEALLQELENILAKTERNVQEASALKEDNAVLRKKCSMYEIKLQQLQARCKQTQEQVESQAKTIQWQEKLSQRDISNSKLREERDEALQSVRKLIQTEKNEQLIMKKKEKTLKNKYFNLLLLRFQQENAISQINSVRNSKLMLKAWCLLKKRTLVSTYTSCRAQQNSILLLSDAFTTLYRNSVTSKGLRQISDKRSLRLKANAVRSLFQAFTTRQSRTVQRVSLLAQSKVLSYRLERKAFCALHQNRLHMASMVGYLSKARQFDAKHRIFSDMCKKLKETRVTTVGLKEIFRRREKRLLMGSLKSSFRSAKQKRDKGEQIKNRLRARSGRLFYRSLLKLMLTAQKNESVFHKHLRLGAGCKLAEAILSKPRHLAAFFYAVLRCNHSKRLKQLEDRLTAQQQQARHNEARLKGRKAEEQQLLYQAEKIRLLEQKLDQLSYDQIQKDIRYEKMRVVFESSQREMQRKDQEVQVLLERVRTLASSEEDLLALQRHRDRLAVDRIRSEYSSRSPMVRAFDCLSSGNAHKD